MLVAGAEVLLAVIGIVFAIIGLAGTTREGNQGILGKSIAGLLISGLLLALFAFGFISGFEHTRRANAQATREMRQAEADLNANLKKSLNSKAGITNLDQIKFDEFQGRISNSFQNLSGDDAKIGQAMNSFLSEIKKEAKNYEAASGKLREFQVLGIVTNRATLAERRKIVEQFIAANDTLTGVLTNAEKNLREQLQSLKVSPRKVEEAIAGYHDSASSRLSLTTQIRACDDGIGHAPTRSMPSTFWIKNGGNWSYDTAQNRIRFENSSAREAYSFDLSEIRSNGQHGNCELQKALDPT